MTAASHRRAFPGRDAAGFTLPELLIAMTIMLIISGAAVSALLKMTAAQATIWNRTQMHSGIRGATEVLQQEVGQAGRIALPMNAASVPYAVTLASGVTVPVATPVVPVTATLTISSTKPSGATTQGMFLNQKLVIGTGDAQETVTLSAPPTSNSITAAFSKTHAAGEPVLALGAFGTGVVPPLNSPDTYTPGGATFTYANGSTGTVLKLYGDINADGNMVYIEYTCDTVGHNLYRNMMDWDEPTKPAVSAKDVLLSNITDNPNSTPCFTYQTAVVGGNVYVTDVAITLTVRTQLIDPVTKQYQTQTKALLNVSPRNTFNAWQMASLGIANRIQPMPPSVTALLAPLP
jgi:prepilin-type N-terminal cleavage/methylation domain-containing protein